MDFFEVAEIMYRQFNQWLNLDLEHSGVRPPDYQINKLPDIPKSPKVNYEKKKIRQNSHCASLLIVDFL